MQFKLIGEVHAIDEIKAHKHKESGRRVLSFPNDAIQPEELLQL